MGGQVDLQLAVLPGNALEAIEERLALVLLAEHGPAVGQQQPPRLDVERDRLEHLVGHDLGEQLVETGLERGARRGRLHEHDAVAGRAPEDHAPRPDPHLLEGPLPRGRRSAEVLVDPGG